MMSSPEEGARKRLRTTCPKSPGAEALLNLDSSLTELFNFSPVAATSPTEPPSVHQRKTSTEGTPAFDPSTTTAAPGAAPSSSPVLCRKAAPTQTQRRRACRVRLTPSPACSASGGGGGGGVVDSPPPADFSQEPSQLFTPPAPLTLALTARRRSVPAVERLRRRLSAGAAPAPSPPEPPASCWPPNTGGGAGVSQLNVTHGGAGVSQFSEAPSSCEPESQRRRAALMRAVESQLPPCSAIGPFHGLPSLVQTLLAKQRGITSLYAWQEECLRLPAVLKRQNLLYSLPTSGGKTLVAELLILKEVLCRHRDAVLVLPYVAIVQEKVRALAPFGIALGFLIEEYAGSRGAFPPIKRRKRRVVYVCTIEKASGLVNSLLEAGRLDEIGLAVVDEVHMIGEPGGRGATLELLITKLKEAAPSAHLVGMSATIGNMPDLASFLEAEVYQGQFRPVQLREHVLIGGQLLEVTAPPAAAASADDWRALLTPRRTPLFQYSEQQRQRDPDGVGGLVAEVVPDASCLVFCPTRKNCENVARMICSALKSDLKSHLLDRKKSLFAALVSEGGGTVCPTLRQTLPYGVAYHHSGLTTDERKLLEEAYLEGTLCCLCCTSTLAAGVNLPAKRVVLRSPYTGSAFLSRGRYKQMVGRAGRAGLDDSGESILIVSPRDAQMVGRLLTSPMERCVSTLLEQDGHGVRRLLLSAVALGLADTPAALARLLERTLLATQADQLKVDLSTLVADTVAALRKERLLRVCRRPDTAAGGDPATRDAATRDAPRPDAARDAPDVTSRDAAGRDAARDAAARDGARDVTRDGDSEEVTVEETGEGQAWSEQWLLKVSRLGTAAVKGNVDLRVAGRLYADLRRAQSALAVINQLHLLYLVTPYDMMDVIQPCAGAYLDMYTTLEADEAAVARLIGVTEAQVVRMMSGKKATDAPVAHRFYLTLVLHEALRGGGSLWETADRCQLHRGQLQSLLQSAAAFAAAVLHFCRQLDELWPFVQLLDAFNRRLATGAAVELAQLLELPAVKQGRARALYAAGFKTLQDVANADPEVLVRTLDHLPRRVARQIVDSAKMLVLEKAEALQEEAEFMLDGLKSAQFHASPGLGEVLLNSARTETAAPDGPMPPPPPPPPQPLSPVVGARAEKPR